MKLVIGELVVLDTVLPKRVSVYNPEIVDIVKVTDKEVSIVAKDIGITVLVIWDAQGQKKYDIIVHPKDLDMIQRKLKQLINDNMRIDSVYLRKNETTGRIMIMGEVNKVQKEQIDKVLEQFKGKDEIEFIDNILTIKPESKMVEIDCQILELSKNDLDDLGIEWNQFFDLREEPYSSTTSTSGVDTSLNVTAKFRRLWSVSEWSRDAIISKINTLVQRGSGRVLSRPKLLCLNGQEANLTVGGEVPYISGSTTSAAGTGVSVEYKEYGVILKIKPTILSDDNVILNLETEVSELDWDNGITVASIKVPAFAAKKASTVVNLASGDTLFIGGLIKNDEQTNIDKFPALGDIPILGAVFRSKRFQDKETELVITLTPLIKESKKKSPPAELLEAKLPEVPSNYAVYPEYLRGDSSLSDYILRIQGLIFKSLDYPQLAKEAGWQGFVKLKLHLNYDGEVMDIRIVESSGYVTFDKEVVRVARSLSPYPPFPPNIDLEDIWIDIPIVYKMD